MTAWTEPSSSFTATVIDGPTTGPAWGGLVTGDVINYERVMNSHAMQMIVSMTGAGGYQMFLQGSLDGTNFYNLGGPYGGGMAVVENEPAQFVRTTLSPYTDSGPPGSVFTATTLVIAQESA
jgi:hypothetical protein